MHAMPAAGRQLFVLAVVLALPAPASAGAETPTVLDVFGRPVEALRLVDWEGHIANPALRFELVAPEGTAFPATATLTADHPRLYFLTPNATVGPGGPTKTLFVPNGTPVPFRFSLFPNREGGDEQHALTATVVGADGATSSVTLPVLVTDQDWPERPLDFRIHTDFDQDESGFFDDDVRAVVSQAADDWAYFLADPGYDEIPPGTSSMYIWDWPLAWTPGGGFHFAWNATAYTGFLLYAYGIQTPEMRSGGSPTNACCLQSVGGQTLPLWTTGSVSIDVAGNYGNLGWIVNTDEDLWWASGNFNGETPDLYSIALHEMGHAIAFTSTYQGLLDFQLAGAVDDPDVVAYQGAAVPTLNGPDHFSAVDRISRRGAFGNGFAGLAPVRRRLVTRLDVLLLAAVGHPLREVASLAPFEVVDTELAHGKVGVPYQDELAATGGVPFYDFVVEGGVMPPGLELDRVTGEVAGAPRQPAVAPLHVRVRDADDGGDGQVVETVLTVGDTWEPIGGGFADPGPRLGAVGSPASRVALHVHGANPGGEAYLVAGASEIDAPFQGGVLIPQPDVVLGPFDVDTAGTLVIEGRAPTAGPSTVITLQIWVRDGDDEAATWCATPGVRFRP
jgi:hypothetical protein